MLLLSAAFKLSDPQIPLAFISALTGGSAIDPYLFAAISFLELSFGALCLLGFSGRIVLRATGFLFVFFSLLMLYATLAKVSVRCGCFGKIVAGKPSLTSVMKDFLLAVLAFSASKVADDRLTLRQLFNRFL